MTQEVNIKGVDKADLLTALFNNTVCSPWANPYEVMSKNTAQKIIAQEGTDFDYLRGRLMKIDFGGDTVNPWGYDRDNGDGAVANIVAKVRASATPAVSSKSAVSSKAEVKAKEKAKRSGLGL